MIDPYRILGIAPTEDDQLIRAAYLEAVRRCPPERDVCRFERIRAAYEAVRDARARLRHELFHADPPGIDEVLEAIIAPSSPRRPALERLLRVLEGK